LSHIASHDADKFLYDGSERNLTDKLRQLITKTNSGELWGEDSTDIKTQVKRFQWNQLADTYDHELEEIVTKSQQSNNRY
jgi:hypothetical protein